MSLDKDGYPTKPGLKKIKAWDVIRDPYGLAEFIEDNWWMAGWGYRLHGRKLELHTGGWSGNEETISVLQRTFFWTFYWVSSRRGGHYYFELPKKAAARSK